MKRTLLTTTSALVFSALVMVGASAQAATDAYGKQIVEITNPRDIENSDAYKNATPQAQAEMRAWALNVFTDRSGATNSTTSFNGVTFSTAVTNSAADLRNASTADVKAAIAKLPPLDEEAEKQKAYADLKKNHPTPSISNPTAQQQAEWDQQLMLRAEAHVRAMKDQRQAVIDSTYMNAYNREAAANAVAATNAANSAAAHPGRDAVLKRISDRAIAAGISQQSYNVFMQRALQEINQNISMDTHKFGGKLPDNYAYSAPEIEKQIGQVEQARDKWGAKAGAETDPVVAKLENTNAIAMLNSQQQAANPDPYRAKKIELAKGYIPASGVNTGKDGSTIDSDGVVRDKNGNILGKIAKNGDTFDKDLNLVNDPNGNFISTLGSRGFKFDEAASKASAPAGNLSAPTVNVSLPASGETKQLANGHTINSSGVIKDAKGTSVGILTEQGKFLTANKQPLAADQAAAMLQLFNTQDGSKTLGLSGAGKKGDCGPGTGKEIAQPIGPVYTQKNSYVAATDKGEMYISVTDEEINNFIRANLNDPAAIAAAMKKYGVNLDRIQKATGYTREEMVDYIAKSGNADLKTHLTHWNSGQTSQTAAAADVSLEAAAGLTASEAARNKIFNDPFYYGGGTGNLDVQRAIGVIHADLMAQTKTQYDAMSEPQQIAWKTALRQRATQLANGLAKGYRDMTDRMNDPNPQDTWLKNYYKQSRFTDNTPEGYTKEEYSDLLYRQEKGRQEGYDAESNHPGLYPAKNKATVEVPATR